MLALPVPQGYDITQHLRFAATYQDAIIKGSLSPTWAAVDNHGFGSVGVRVYPPLADYVLAITQLVTDDWYATLFLNSFFWMLPGCVGVFVWVREFRDSQCAWIAAFLYSLMPYHLLQIYRMQLYSEFVAAAILPFCFLFATRLARTNHSGSIIGFAASCSLLLLTHIPACIIGGIALFVYVAILTNKRTVLSVVWRFGLASLIAVAGASYYLIRLLLEVGWVRHSSQEFSTGFFSSHRFLFPIYLSFGEGYAEYSLWRLDVAIALTLLFFLPILFFLTHLDLVSTLKKFERRVLMAVGMTGLVSLAMLSAVSRFLWDSIEILQKLQFPFRFLSVLSLVGAVVLAVAVSVACDSRRRSAKVIFGLSVAVIVATVVFDVSKVIFDSKPMLREDFYRTMVDVRETEGCECWWPIWSKAAALENRQKVTVSDRNIEIARWDADVRVLKIEPGTADRVRLATFYYPYWKATINEQDAPVRMDETGSIVLSIPREKSDVTVYFEEPAIYSAAQAVSIGTWIGMLIWLAVRLSRSFNEVRAYPADA